jgi:hypothetical protein
MAELARPRSPADGEDLSSEDESEWEEDSERDGE